MINSLRFWPVFRFLWTILALVASFPVWAEVVGTSAWGGVNLVICIYLCCSTVGYLGMTVGFFSAFSARQIPAWITGVSAIIMSFFGLLLAGGFLFGRDPSFPWDSPEWICGVKAPTLMYDTAGFFVCLIEAMLFFPKTRKV